MGAASSLDTYRLFALAFLCFAVGAVFLFGRFSRRSVFMSPAADVLKRDIRQSFIGSSQLATVPSVTTGQCLPQ